MSYVPVVVRVDDVPHKCFWCDARFLASLYSTERIEADESECVTPRSAVPVWGLCAEHAERFGHGRQARTLSCHTAQERRQTEEDFRRWCR